VHADSKKGSDFKGDGTERATDKSSARHQGQGTGEANEAPPALGRLAKAPAADTRSPYQKQFEAMYPSLVAGSTAAKPKGLSDK